jgi:tetratricopeptide (TPR) repeat protein
VLRYKKIIRNVATEVFSESEKHTMTDQRNPLSIRNSRLGDRNLVTPAAVAIFAVLSLVLYAGPLNAPFEFDSVLRIKDNPAIRVDTLSVKTLSAAAFGEQSASKRPIGNLTFALNYYVNGDTPRGYRLVNIAVHAAAAVFLYLLLVRTLSLPAVGCNRRRAAAVAFCAVLIWLVHPVHTQSVTYVVQRLNSLAALFYLIAFWLYVKGRRAHRRWPWLAGCGFSWLMALGCKQTAVSLPALGFVYEWYFFQDLSRAWLRRSLKYVIGAALLVGGVAVVYLGPRPLEYIGAARDFASGEFTLTERLLTQPRVVLRYLTLFFFPHPARLNLDYDVALSRSLLDPPATAVAILVLAALLAAAVRIARKERLLSFCILWFFGNLLIESSVIPLAIIFEHRTYLPYAMVAAAAAVLVWRFIRPPAAAVVACALTAAVFSVWTVQRNAVWSDPVRLWTDTVTKSPEKARAHNNLGLAMEEARGLAAAAPHYARAVQLDPNYWEALSNLGRAMYEEKRYREAETYWTRRVQIQSADADAHVDLGNALLMQGKASDAIARYVDALDREPGNPDALTALGNAYLQLGDAKKAVSQFEAAIAADPEAVDAHVNLAAVLMQTGRMESARDHLTKALRIDPENPQAHNNLGTLLMQAGQIAAAVGHFRRATASEPDFTDAAENLARAQAVLEDVNTREAELLRTIAARPQDPAGPAALGHLYRSAGRWQDALDQYRRALVITPDFDPALAGAASAYAALGQYDRAITLLTRIGRRRPDRADVDYNIACMYALKNQVPEALHWLKRAIEKGYDRWDQIASDPDLENLRRSPAYQELIRNR